MTDLCLASSFLVSAAKNIFDVKDNLEAIFYLCRASVSRIIRLTAIIIGNF